ncbi:uncharacterized protein GVI51_F00209 [Nakaseomyces glabratus]|uniref:Uncharacterized protein n=2 Tax=Candida glabrata TaxID=5478 RepID=Q6FUV5_CANGA|nr:uncharacterized protein CAGL0F00341g [Nakaseomyces glabratus]KAH7587485.1 hypothetical protein J7298_01254 [Nakaseomyces glabratus]KAH7603968.1 hypothetical protein J7295_01260 [Nakaseomyces glabratus]KAH7604953.1 hypothetical protein J7294_01246 [Nakaseomyces glabratus]KAH7607269.1 hypothetical protein J7293_01245 [Nakaseomyces glabratus]KAH7613961.1 hypothetical protein J7292_01235 [Nakaseomyces glabratus]|eukprot:XP_445989.1 uncharacterized protein CAGL0F00341g [[Candida] glabrata]
MSSVYLVPAKIELVGNAGVPEEIKFEEVAQLRGKELHGEDLIQHLDGYHGQLVKDGKIEELSSVVDFEREEEIFKQELNAFKETADILSALHN